MAMNPNPSLSFGELPSFADSILYPEKRQHQIPDPTTRATFQGRPGPRADPCEKLQGNIRLEGEYTCTWRVSAHVPRGWVHMWEPKVVWRCLPRRGGCLPRRGLSTRGRVSA